MLALILAIDLISEIDFSKTFDNVHHGHVHYYGPT